MSALAAAYLDWQQRGGIADLSARTKIRLTGADRVRYLNGQVTANVSRVTENASLRACVTTAKGKLSADIFISTEPRANVEAGFGGLIVDAEPELRETLLARLERYIIADDATLEDLTDEVSLLHFLPAPGAGLESLRGIEWSPVDPMIKSHRFGRPGFDMFLPPGAVPVQLEHFFREHHAILDEPLLETLRIEAGVPRWGRELSEDTLPPEAGLDRTHVDYHKGCYIGQEVISRLKSVGHVNRQLLGFVPNDDVPLAPGLQLFAPGDDVKPLGHLTSAAWSFALSKPVALGYLRRGSPTDALLARPPHGGGPAIPVTARELPFVTT